MSLLFVWNMSGNLVSVVLFQLVKIRRHTRTTCNICIISVQNVIHGSLWPAVDRRDNMWKIQVSWHKQYPIPNYTRDHWFVESEPIIEFVYNEHVLNGCILHRHRHLSRVSADIFKGPELPQFKKSRLLVFPFVGSLQRAKMEFCSCIVVLITVAIGAFAWVKYVGLEYILIHYRWMFVCLFLMPISLIYDVGMLIRSWIIFKLNSAPDKHVEKVRKVQQQVNYRMNAVRPYILPSSWSSLYINM